MDWVTGHPPIGDKSYNSCLVIVDRYSKTPKYLPCHKDDTSMGTALLLWSRVISHTGLFKKIIRDRVPNSHLHFGPIFKDGLGPTYHSKKSITLKQMDSQKE
ncbi:hypothetical protein O181_125250 [Austropuccinia psidii MF-1]|uniref:Integrase catalytic domain-containing protein n=1 Tax=Austropuccinia psidii MF-1 TaxID=1389203 RepID=A0A9Q3KUI1_9BASI|nr:hypothetical protein [Austropuccinia psidii MF-1]